MSHGTPQEQQLADDSDTAFYDDQPESPQQNQDVVSAEKELTHDVIVQIAADGNLSGPDMESFAGFLDDEPHDDAGGTKGKN